MSRQEILIAIYAQWCVNKRLPCLDAEELIAEVQRGSDSESWLSRYIIAWDNEHISLDTLVTN